MSICKKCNAEIKEGVAFCGICGAPVNKDSALTEKLKHKFPVFIIASILYAIFYTVCLYENLTGITFPFFILGTIFFYGLCIKKLELKIKKFSWIYFSFMMLIAISMFLTDDPFIHFFNYFGLLVLVIVSMLTNFYNEGKWEVGKYIGSMFRVGIGAIGNIYRPFSDFENYRKERKHEPNKRLTSLLIGISISVPLLIIIIALLASADAVFGNVFREIFDDADFVLDIMKIVVIIFSVFVLSYGLIAKLSKQDILEKSPDRKKGDPIIAITITGLLSVVYIIFSAIQIIYLFMGKMSLPEGYTYAKYAREGFFQLLFICLINLLIVLLCTSLFKKNKILQIVLTIISLCTYVMIASSALRMIMYIKGYDLTILRILVLWALGVIALLLLGLGMKIFVDKFPLFRFGLIVISVLYIGLAFSKPDYYIAKYNLYNTVGEIDCDYLVSLSDDAAQAFNDYCQEDLENGNGNNTALLAIKEYFKNPNKTKYEANIRNFNLSRYRFSEIKTQLKNKN